MLIAAHDLSKSFGSKVLFDGLSLSLERRERVGLIGPNGSGKSTLMKLFVGSEVPDSGNVAVQKGAVISYVGQEFNFDQSKTVGQALSMSLKNQDLDDIEIQTRIGVVVSQLGFEDAETELSMLSGGWLKRVSIGQALVKHPDLLLLDEPTNHMDWEGIYWLEKFLKSAKIAFLLVSHDRTFLENVTNRIVEINRGFEGGYLSFSGNYSKFLEKKAEYFEAQEKMQSAMSNKLRREVEWLRRSPQARTTKSRSRIKATHNLANDVGAIRERNLSQNNSISVEFGKGESKSTRLMEIKDGRKEYPGKLLFEKLNLVLTPGVCLGILGLNGSGKTTLLKVLTGEIELDDGEIESADHLKITYFDQKRETLDSKFTLMKNLTGGDSDHVIYLGKSLHGAAYARKFLFRVEQFNMRVENLSGGERARLLLAKMMLKEADLLLLDEPTNDLDIETLAVLEKSMEEFPGAIVLVSHDRCFLEKMTSSLLSLEGNGTWSEYSDFWQWENLALRNDKMEVEKKTIEIKKPGASKQKKKLSYTEQKEFETIEDDILDAEEKLLERQKILEDPKVMADSEALNKAIAVVGDLQTKVEYLYERWEYLEQKKKGAE